MILRKPYAFLIKYFRIIHISLLLPLIYLIIKTGSIVHFFSDYIQANYYTSITNIAGTYINYFMYFAILIILGIGIAIYYLMRKKEKPTKLYFFLIVFYIILLIVLGITHSILSGMEITTMEATKARAYRDISYLFYLPQFFFAGFTLIRGIGFDIRKFNFELDIKELEITDIDNEEFELTLGIEDYKIKRNIRRFFREFKYYVKENKFVFTILCSIVGIIIVTLLYLNIEVYNKKYKQTQILSHNNLNISVTGSMLTNKDYGGRTFKDNKYYLVLQLSIENRGKESTTLDYNNFYIELPKKRVYPILDRAAYFIDFGEIIRQDTELIPQNPNTYILVYELADTELEEEYTLKILEQISYQVGEIAPNYKTVSLKPQRAIELIDKKTIELGKILTFEDSNIGYSSLQINDVSLTNSYSYEYEYCQEQTKCRNLTDKVVTNSSRQTLMILDANYTVDQSTLYYKSARTNRLLPDHFITIEYENITGRHILEVENKTPLTYKNGFILQVSSEINGAENMDLVMTIRNQKYRIHLI